MSKKITSTSNRNQKALRQNMSFVEALVWILAIPTTYLAISINVHSRSFNIKKLQLPLFGDCQMMELLVYGTLILPFALFAIHLLYWEYQRHAKTENDGVLRLPSSMGHLQVPPAYRNLVSVVLAVTVLVLPLISYVDLTYQLQKYCRIVPSRVVDKTNDQIAESDSLGGAGLFLFPLKRPGRETDSQFYWINHYKYEKIEAGVSGNAGRAKVSAFYGQPLLIALFGLASVLSTGLIFWRAKARGTRR